ncbi:MAG: sfr [Jatrophihabitantaceae bacterium]|nr:sfr [Jatrophihabitantaceae bacterium]
MSVLLIDRPLTPLRTRIVRSRIDWLLALSALLLGLIGALLVWSATRSSLASDGGNPQSYLFRHLANLVLATLVWAGAAQLPVRLMRFAGPVLYVVSMLGLIAVLLVGTTVNGAHSWIELPGFDVQPAEFAKVGLITGLAVLFSGRSDRPRTPAVLIALGLAAFPLGLIMLQPDLGSALVVCAALLGVLIAADVQARWMIGLVLAAIVGAIVAVKVGVLADYQLERFEAFTQPGRDIQGAGYNVHQAQIAIANGGLTGAGLFQGPQTRGEFVPEQQTDFIFSVAGEELGFLGAALIIGLFGVLLVRALRIARDADRVGRLVAAGVVSWFGFQIFENIGMNLGIMPVTGLPLPFVSYGGSSMLAGGLALGLLQAIHASNVRRSG